MQKGQNLEILNQNNRRLERLKIHVISQKSHVLMGETLEIFFIFERPVTLIPITVYLVVFMTLR